jgi:signal transduction histidine kinase
VRLEYLDDCVRLEIHDDGVGLAARESGNPASNVHAGLRTIRQRLEALGGSFKLERPDPRGLVLTAEVPL